MTGWRIGWACGNAKLIAALAKVKSNIDSGIFSAIQVAGIEALEGPQGFLKDTCQIYQTRRNTLINGLRGLGWQAEPPQATFYVWLKIPDSNCCLKSRARRCCNSLDFAAFLLDKANLIVTPGIGFGRYGEGYVRMALTVSNERIQEAVDRLKKIL
jgi:LL-diaminopimelate aminotransferase